MLLGAPLGPLQFIGGIAHHQLDQLRLLLALGNRQPHPPPAPFREPLLDQSLLGQGMLQQQFRGDFHRLHLAVVLLHNPLQDAARVQTGARMAGFRREFPIGRLAGFA